jgi:hypothetical protein
MGSQTFILLIIGSPTPGVPIQICKQIIFLNLHTQKDLHSMTKNEWQDKQEQ